MQGFGYLVTAYAAVWIGLFVYLAVIMLRIRGVRTELTAKIMGGLTDGLLAVSCNPLLAPLFHGRFYFAVNSADALRRAVSAEALIGGAVRVVAVHGEGARPIFPVEPLLARGDDLPVRLDRDRLDGIALAGQQAAVTEAGIERAAVGLRRAERENEPCQEREGGNPERALDGEA